MPTRLKVECYSGYKADKRPIPFSFVGPDSAQLRRRAQTYAVSEVLDRWYGPGYECFKVRADDGNFYILRRQIGEDTWQLDAFRAAGELQAAGRLWRKFSSL